MWHKTVSLPQMNGSIVFARWRQCALRWGHIGATWRIRLNLCFFRPTRVHNSNGKSISSAIFAQLTAQCRRVYWHLPANTIEIVHNGAILWIELNLCFFRTTRVHKPKWQIDRFSRLCTTHDRKSLYFTMGNLFPKIAPSRGGSGPPPNSWFLEPVWAHNPNSISIGSAVLAQVTAECPYALQWDALIPPQNCPFP